MIFTRRTVGAVVELQGLGLHSGEPVRVLIHPSESGIVFRSGSDRVVAKPENVSDTSLCTRIGSISTIEHLMSAFAGLEITDAEVELDALELPALDGSAIEYCRAMLAAGVSDLGKRRVTGPFSRIFVKNGEEKVAVGTGEGHWRYAFFSNDKYPFDQTFESTDIVRDYVEHVAPARTFGWECDIPEVERLGLARGLDEESVVVLTDQGSRLPMRFPDEPARHKLLDAIGDLYLSGVPIRALNFVGERTGHRMNVDAARKLSEAVKFEDV